MSARKRVAQGFTLVEILIVVVILGILAAIVIPQFTSASEMAKKSSLESTLQTLRSQLELYQVQHTGDYPAADLDNGNGEWTALTEATEVDGAEGDASGNEYGPYMQKPPVNPFTDASTVSTATASGGGWVYTAATGNIKAIVPSAKMTELSLSTVDCVAEPSGT
jgi:general secretion pathway protein G